MSSAEEPARYRDFLTFVFDRPETAPHSSDAWYFNDDDEFKATHAEFIELYHCMLRNCRTDLAPFTDGQIALGLSYLFNNSCGSTVFAFMSDDAPMSERVAALLSLKQLYDDCFDRRCASVLGHTEEEGGNLLNGVCYMFWDVTPLGYWPDREKELAPLTRAIFEVLEHALMSANEASIESALHGLGHLNNRYQVEVENLIDNFLISRPKLSISLRSYAELARRGCVL